MPSPVKAGSILIREGTPVPVSLVAQMEPFRNGWRLVKDMTARRLSTEIREGGWSLFALAGDHYGRAIGFDESKTIDAAIQRVLSGLQAEKSNCLEITRVELRSVLGLLHVRVSSCRRHIRRSSVTKVYEEWNQSKLASR
jgi:hypothetical protein